MQSSPNIDYWVNENEQVTVFVKTGPKFTIYTPQEFRIENIVMDFTESFLAYHDDPMGWLTKREVWCENQGNGILSKKNEGQIETWELREPIETHNYYVCFCSDV